MSEMKYLETPDKVAVARSSSSAAWAVIPVPLVPRRPQARPEPWLRDRPAGARQTGSRHLTVEFGSHACTRRPRQVLHSVYLALNQRAERHRGNHGQQREMTRPIEDLVFYEK